jgi:hypothetical protein
LRRKTYLAGTFRRTLTAGTRELRLAAQRHKGIHDFVRVFVLECVVSMVEDLTERKGWCWVSLMKGRICITSQTSSTIKEVTKRKRGDASLIKTPNKKERDLCY